MICRCPRCGGKKIGPCRKCGAEDREKCSRCDGLGVIRTGRKHKLYAFIFENLDHLETLSTDDALAYMYENDFYDRSDTWMQKASLKHWMQVARAEKDAGFKWA